MLNYIVTVTEDLAVTAILVTLLYAFSVMVFDRLGKLSQKIGIGAGLFASAAMAVAKNVTSKIATNRWNLYIFYAGIAFTVLFLCFSLLAGKKRGALKNAASVSAGALSAILIFYEVPDVMAYPFNFETLGKGVVSLDYLLRLLGWTAALLLLYVLMRFLYQSIRAYDSRKLLAAVLYASLLANAFRFFGMVLSKWIARPKWLVWPVFRSADHPWAFPVAKFVANNTLFFIVLTEIFALVIPAALAVRSLSIREPYDNPAQRRKLLARNRRYRRWMGIVTVCLALSVVNLTAVRASIHQEVVLSEPETYEISGETICIPLEELADGHLHRYEYTTDNGVDVRWIIIQKPGSGAYGVGLDACNVCGVAGYFERDGQVVCKRCDVVMNINTIGFKGGCNPIPLEYTVADGAIEIPLAAVIDGEKKFE